jgi:steroid 5-alpha reductase family enzyme
LRIFFHRDSVIKKGFSLEGFFMLWIFSMLGALFIYMTLLFFLAQRWKDWSIADLGWAGGFLLLAFISLYTQYIHFKAISIRQIVVFACVFLWAIRLTSWLMYRHKGEDPRYQKLRASWHSHPALKAYGFIFLLQGVLMIIIMAPVLLIHSTYDQKPLTILDYLGFALWCIGFICEAVGDWQLFRFISQPHHAGRIMKYGLWRYTRHPNYFGELAMWWGLWLVALNVPYGWATICAPVTLTILLLYVSGIALLEKQFEHNPEFQEYKRKTSPLIPWFVK